MDDKRLAELRGLSRLLLDHDVVKYPLRRKDLSDLLAEIDRLKGLWQWMAEAKVYSASCHDRDAWYIVDDGQECDEEFAKLPHGSFFDTPLEAIQAYRAFKEGR